MSGKLQKMGVVNKRFKERWFVLSGNKLFYYKSKDANAAIHFIPLDEAFIRVSSEYYPASPCFEIVTGSRIFQLVAPNFPTMNDWIQSAQKHSNIYNDNRVIALVEQDIIQQEREMARVRMLSEEALPRRDRMPSDATDEEVNCDSAIDSDEPWTMIEYSNNDGEL